MFPDGLPPGLTAGEVELLADALSDEPIGFVWILDDLGIRDDSSPASNWRPSWTDVDRAFTSLQKLVDLGLIWVGRVDGLPAEPSDSTRRASFTPETLIDVRARVLGDIDGDKWEWSCWAVPTLQLEEVARTPR